MSDSRSSKEATNMATEATWYAEDIPAVFAAFDTHKDGLSSKEANARYAEDGANVFTDNPEPGVIARVFSQLKSPLAFILLIAFVITAALGEYIDAGVILFALLIAVFVGVLQEGKASRAFKKLADSQVKVATVIRNGQKHEIEAAQLVLGDIVVLQGGARVPADIRLIETKKLTANESALTGEWEPLRKNTEPVAVGTPLSDRTNMAWMGTYIVQGSGTGVVVAIGDDTEVGGLAQDLHTIDDEQTPLQEEMRRVSMFMLYLISGLVLLIFGIGLVQGQSLHDMLLMSIAIAVASIPEGLPAAVTIILAVGMETLLRRGGLVRNLLAAETLGSTTYVLTDKTGTLTQARMVLSGVIHSEDASISTNGWGESTAIRRMFDISLCATEVYEDMTEEGTVLRGDPVERAVYEAARELGIKATGDSLRGRRSDYLAFTSDNRFAAGVAPEKDKNEQLLCVNGAPESLLEHATHIFDAGTVRAMTPEDRTAYVDAIGGQTKEGKRLIAVAYKSVSYTDIPETSESDVELLADGLVFMGVFVFNDPIRKNVGSAIRGVQNAGAEVRLITGDNPETALSVARATGIAGADDRAYTGTDLSELSDAELREVLYTARVFARILPKQKMRIARILQQNGEIVAMTGDGINDGPALRRANIGVAVGSGTEVAKEASDLVLMNDSFAIIYAAIEEGRRIISNLRKIVGYLLATSLSEVVLIGGALLTGAAAPLVPAQILWANVIEEGLMSFAFAFEKGEKDAMRRKPQDIHEEGILSSSMIWFTVFVITILSGLILSLYFYLRAMDVPLPELRSTMFLLVSVDSLFMAFAFRSLTTPFWKIPLTTNIYFIISFLISAGLLAIVLTVPFFQYLLSYQPLPLIDIVLVVGVSVAALVTIEVSKWLFFERKS